MPRGNHNLKGNKNSGDKPDSVKFAEFINTRLANEIGNEELRRIYEKKKGRIPFDLKEIVMPVILKNMTDKKELSGDLIVEISETIAKKRGITPKTK